MPVRNRTSRNSFKKKSGDDEMKSQKERNMSFVGSCINVRKYEESLNVTFDETPPPSKTSPLVDDDLDEDEAIREHRKEKPKNDTVDETLEIDEIVDIKESRNHPLENVIGNLN
ncbi:hypothetical protein Tco_0223916 [Tanacetum coccineum]